MTDQEFGQWWRQFQSAFPAAGEFVKRSVDPQATLEHWRRVLVQRDLCDALAVTIGIFDGVLAAVPGTDRGFPDWSAVPRHVSRLCCEMHPAVPAWKRDQPKQGRLYEPLPAGDALSASFPVLVKVAAAVRSTGGNVALVVHEFHEKWFPRNGSVPIEDAYAAAEQMVLDARAAVALDSEYNTAQEGG
jgi:hypothetical protein